MAVKYIVMIPNYWGRGDSPLEAANAARGVAGKRKAKTMPSPRIVFKYDEAKTPSAYVDDMGALCWDGERPETVERVKVN